MNVEKWDLYNKYREKTGIVHIRGNPIPDGYYHLAVHVWIQNSEGLYLIAQRAPFRENNPLKWECPGGSVIYGENSIEGAIREVKEEIGIKLDSSKGKIIFSKIRNVINGVHYNDMMDVWLFSYDDELAMEKATTNESIDCKWMNKEEIKRLYYEGNFVPALDYFFCAFDQTEKDYNDILGTVVSGIINRPIGSRHPNFPDIVYEVNYGYIPDIKAGDNEDQDVYLFGTKKPVDRFTGKVIAVYHRFNDSEDKWIVSLTNDFLSDEKILGDISFQEQFFYGKLYR